MQRLIYKGAEADILRGPWQGLEAVFKVRKPLAYRLPVLDQAIRRQRTLREAEMIVKARESGVESPRLYHADPSSSTLVMEFVEGPRLKDLVSKMSPRETEGAFQELGRGVAKLHASRLIHGDLTTANLVRRDDGLVFLDFGLSYWSSRIEDYAVDLRLAKETLSGAHPSVAATAMRALTNGYSSVSGESRTKAVLSQLRSVERRGRYARVG